MPPTTRSRAAANETSPTSGNVESVESEQVLATAGIPRARFVAQSANDRVALLRASASTGGAVPPVRAGEAIDVPSDQRAHSVDGISHSVSPGQIAHLHRLGINIDASQLNTILSVLTSPPTSALATPAHEVKKDGDEAAHEVGRLPERRQPEGAADNRVGADRDGLHAEAPVRNPSSASAAGISSDGSSRRGMTDSERALRTEEGAEVLSSLGRAIGEFLYMRHFTSFTSWRIFRDVRAQK